MAVPKLKQILDESMISVAELARESGLSEGTVRHVLGGKHAPRVPTKRKILAGLQSLLGEKKRPLDQHIFN
jgi:predicted transcriptional regulator